jgi:hypothetical protein
MHRSLDEVRSKPGGPAHEDVHSANTAAQSAAGARLKSVGRQPRQSALAGSAQDSMRQRVLAVLLERRSRLQNLPHIGRTEESYARQFRLAAT